MVINLHEGAYMHTVLIKAHIQEHNEAGSEGTVFY